MTVNNKLNLDILFLRLDVYCKLYFVVCASYIEWFIQKRCIWQYRLGNSNYWIGQIFAFFGWVEKL